MTAEQRNALYFLGFVVLAVADFILWAGVK